jgi:tRNA threonylcarbamoyl adenosine modification protein YjeE
VKSDNQACPPVFTSHSAEETEVLAQQLALLIQKGDVVLLEGPLGAGKTTFAKALIASLAKIDPYLVASPTFTYMNQYTGQPPIHHFDLYRIDNDLQLESLGLLDFINEECISIIEWPQKVRQVAKLGTITISLSYIDAQTRTISIKRLNT